MEAYIARQPIFNQKKKVTGYELLYRDVSSLGVAQIRDGDLATCHLLSDAITLFGLPQLTNHLPAYINFTQNLLMSDFVLALSPQDAVIEILESVTPDELLLQRILELKKMGYQFALDDYTGNPKFEPLLPYIDILKVDFIQTNAEQQARIAHACRPGCQLLAEKVETEYEFSRAAAIGYRLFQGYFFQRPILFEKKLPSIATSTYGRLLRELQRATIDFDCCAKIIHTDVSLTYRLMRKVQTVYYYRGNGINAIKQALVMLGSDEVYRWILLILARENNVSHSDELVRSAYFRGTFLAHLMRETRYASRSEEGFLLGMLSLLDRILGLPMEKVLQDIQAPAEISLALLGTEHTVFSPFMEYILVYELGGPSLELPPLDFIDPSCYVPEIYMECIAETDEAFSSI